MQSGRGRGEVKTARFSKNAFWMIVGFALAIRIAAVLLTGELLERDMSLDASSYHAIAQNLVEHHIFSSPFDPPYHPDQSGTFRPPLTPFFLAAIYAAVTGAGILWGQMGLVVIISALTCGLTYRLGAQLFDPNIGLLAGVLTSCYPLLLLFVLLPLTEGLSIFLTLALLNVLYDEQAGRMRPIMLIGLIFGLLLMNKAANIVVFPVCLYGHSGTYPALTLRGE